MIQLAHSIINLVKIQNQSMRPVLCKECCQRSDSYRREKIFFFPGSAKLVREFYWEIRDEQLKIQFDRLETLKIAGCQCYSVIHGRSSVKRS